MIKGQISVEHIVLLGVVLVILLPGVYIFYNSTIKMNEEFEEIIIKSAGEDIIDTISTVSALGDLTKKTVLLDLPESFKNVTVIGNNTFVITYENSKGTSQMVFISNSVLRGSTIGYSIQDVVPGRTKLAVQNNKGLICLTQQGGDCLSSCGNRILEPSLNETCDGPDIGGLTCNDFGYNGGILTCNYDCSQVITNLCTGCPTTGNICADQNLITSGPNYLESQFVIEALGDTSSTPDNEVLNSATTGYESFSCGHNGFYSLRNGGGIKIDTSNLNLSTGLYTLSTTLYYNPLDTDSHLGIQCDGFITDIPRRPSNIDAVTTECLFDSSNPDIRFLGHGTQRVNLDNFVLTSMCDPSVCIPPHDSGFVCLSQGHSVSGGDVESDFIDFERGFGDEGDYISWGTLQDEDQMNLGEYEQSCNYLYYSAPANPPVGQSHDSEWKIEGSDFDNLISGAGDYTLYMNVIFGNQSLPSRFTIRCGDTPEVPLVSNSPGFRSYHYMETVQIDCEFDDDGNDIIRIESHGSNSRSIYVEQFRLIKKCP